MIRVTDVCKSFRSGHEEIEALRGVSFEVPCGACGFIVGPSRSGKSTLRDLPSVTSGARLRLVAGS
jgi:putative ABC transport system ATP-binding protein